MRGERAGSAIDSVVVSPAPSRSRRRIAFSNQFLKRKALEPVAKRLCQRGIRGHSHSHGTGTKTMAARTGGVLLHARRAQVEGRRVVLVGAVETAEACGLVLDDGTTLVAK